MRKETQNLSQGVHRRCFPFMIGTRKPINKNSSSIFITHSNPSNRYYFYFFSPKKLPCIKIPISVSYQLDTLLSELQGMGGLNAHRTFSYSYNCIFFTLWKSLGRYFFPELKIKFIIFH